MTGVGRSRSFMGIISEYFSQVTQIDPLFGDTHTTIQRVRREASQPSFESRSVVGLGPNRGVLSARVRSHRSPGPRGQAERSGGHVRNLAGQSRRCLGRGRAGKSWNSFPRHDLNQVVIAPGPVGSPRRRYALKSPGSSRASTSPDRPSPARRVFATRRGNRRRWPRRVPRCGSGS